MQLLAALVPGGPHTFALTRAVVAGTPALAGLIVVGPNPHLLAAGIVAFDAKLAGGAPVEVPLAVLHAVHHGPFHVLAAVLEPPCGLALKLVVLVLSLELYLAVLVPLCRLPFAAAIHVGDLLFLLPVGIPRAVDAVLLAVLHVNLALQVAVAVPAAVHARAEAFLTHATPVVVEHRPHAALLAVGVGALLRHLARRVPPRPVARTLAVLAYQALHRELVCAAVILAVHRLAFRQRGCRQAGGQYDD